MSEKKTALYAKLSSELLSFGSSRPCHGHGNDRPHGPPHPSRLACASSRPEHPRNHNPTSTTTACNTTTTTTCTTMNSRQTDPLKAHSRPPEYLSLSRERLRRPAPGPQSPTGHPDDDKGQQALVWEGLMPADTVEAKQFSFFDFPAEIRNMIYHLSLQRPGCADLYRSYYKRGWARTHLKTPTILLLCRRITDESMPILRARRFIIDRLPPCMPPLPGGRGGFLRMSNFISPETLQRLEHVDLRIGLGEGPLGSGWIWNRVLDELILILTEKNSLVHFRLLIRRCIDADDRSMRATEAIEEAGIRRVCAPPLPLFLWRLVGLQIDTWRTLLTC
jgi:hypothetical protein